MKITRTMVAAAVACAALVTGTAVASQAQDDPKPAVVTTDSETLDGIATRAADEAVLAQLCRNADSGPAARKLFEDSAAMHPDLAAQLDDSCAPITPAP